MQNAIGVGQGSHGDNRLWIIFNEGLNTFTKKLRPVVHGEYTVGIAFIVHITYIIVVYNRFYHWHYNFCSTRGYDLIPISNI